MKKLILLFAIVLFAACSTAPQAPLPTVASVDLNRYLGNWYEVHMIPNRFQKMCASDTQANYALQDTWTGDGIKVTNRCRKTDGSVEAVVGVAKVVADSNNAKLKVSFFRPFYGNYWVLALGDGYDWVLVGEPGREFGWVLSRKPTIDDASLNAALSKAEQLGYTRSQFIKTAQTKPLD
jgi:apolipoprotein D and lipocalin family protein